MRMTQNLLERVYKMILLKQLKSFLRQKQQETWPSSLRKLCNPGALQRHHENLCGQHDAIQTIQLESLMVTILLYPYMLSKRFHVFNFMQAFAGICRPLAKLCNEPVVPLYHAQLLHVPGFGILE